MLYQVCCDLLWMANPQAYTLGPSIQLSFQMADLFSFPRNLSFCLNISDPKSHSHPPATLRTQASPVTLITPGL